MKQIPNGPGRVGRCVAQLIREAKGAQDVLSIASACFYWGSRIMAEVKKDEGRVVDICRVAYQSAVADMGEEKEYKMGIALEPDLMLVEILRMAERERDREPPDDASRLGEFVMDLDEWLRSGGRLPARWTRDG